MTIWIVGAVVVVVVLLAVLRVALRSEEDRIARRELRRLRGRERSPNLRGAAEYRRDMTMDPMPGKSPHPGGP